MELKTFDTIGTCLIKITAVNANNRTYNYDMLFFGERGSPNNIKQNNYHSCPPSSNFDVSKLIVGDVYLAVFARINRDWQTHKNRGEAYTVMMIHFKTGDLFEDWDTLNKLIEFSKIGE